MKKKKGIKSTPLNALYDIAVRGNQRDLEEFLNDYGLTPTDAEQVYKTKKRKLTQSKKSHD